VVDDGSTDRDTLEILENQKWPKTTFIRTCNQGLAHARNNGIRVCGGKYILPLDADDKIGNTYLEKAVRVLEANESIGIVYCKAEFFGEATGAWELTAYRLSDILLDNMIFCSAMFRRSDWEKVNGYNPNMIYGWEDYDFWLSLIELGREVFCIPETLFFCRKRSSSLVTAMTREHYIYSYTQLFRNHSKLYTDNIAVLFEERLDLRAKLNRAQRLIKVMELIKFGKLKRAWDAIKLVISETKKA